MKTTNQWPLQDVESATIDPNNERGFTVVLNDRAAGKRQAMTYECNERAFILSELFRLLARATGIRAPQFHGSKLSSRLNKFRRCRFRIDPHALVMLDSEMNELRCWKYVDLLSARAISDNDSAFVLRGPKGRDYCFTCPDRRRILNDIFSRAQNLGIRINVKSACTLADAKKALVSQRNIPASVQVHAEFSLKKIKAGYLVQPEEDGTGGIFSKSIQVNRLCHLTSDLLVERDPLTYAVTSTTPLTSVFALVRDVNDPLKVQVEVSHNANAGESIKEKNPRNDGGKPQKEESFSARWSSSEIRTYQCTSRDAFIASLADAVRRARPGFYLAIDAVVTPLGRRLGGSTLSKANMEVDDIFLRWTATVAREMQSSSSDQLVYAAADLNANLSAHAAAFRDGTLTNGSMQAESLLSIIGISADKFRLVEASLLPLMVVLKDLVGRLPRVRLDRMELRTKLRQKKLEEMKKMQEGDEKENNEDGGKEEDGDEEEEEEEEGGLRAVGGKIFKRLSAGLLSLKSGGSSDSSEPMTEAEKRRNSGHYTPLRISARIRAKRRAEATKEALERDGRSGKPCKVPVRAYVTLLQALHRLLGFGRARQLLLRSEIVDMAALLHRLLEHPDSLVLSWVMKIFIILCLPAWCQPKGQRDLDTERFNRVCLLGEANQRESLLATLASQAKGSSSSEGTILILDVLELLEGVTASFADTTPNELMKDILGDLSTNCDVLMSLFWSPCTAIVEANALLLKTVVARSDPKQAERIRDMALSEGVSLRHFHHGIYGESEDQRFVGRYLSRLWMDKHPDSLKLLKRMLPIAMVHYLDAPRMPGDTLAATNWKGLKKEEPEENEEQQEQDPVRLRIELGQVFDVNLLSAKTKIGPGIRLSIGAINGNGVTLKNEVHRTSCLRWQADDQPEAPSFYRPTKENVLSQDSMKDKGRELKNEAVKTAVSGAKATLGNAKVLFAKTKVALGIDTEFGGQHPLRWKEEFVAGDASSNGLADAQLLVFEMHDTTGQCLAKGTMPVSTVTSARISREITLETPNGMFAKKESDGRVLRPRLQVRASLISGSSPLTAVDTSSMTKLEKLKLGLSNLTRRKESSTNNNTLQLEHGHGFARLRQRIEQGNANIASSGGAVEGNRTFGNFAVFFHMISQDHARPELVWNRSCRDALRRRLESEIRLLENETEITSGRVQISWNHLEFRVRYPSLENELRIGNHYLRFLLDLGEDGKDKGKSLLESSNTVDLRDAKLFFNKLYTRLLRERDFGMRAMCAHAMSIVYASNMDKIGLFEDTPYIARLVDETRHRGVRDRLLELLLQLAKFNENAELLGRQLSILQQALKAAPPTLLIKNSSEAPPKRKRSVSEKDNAEKKSSSSNATDATKPSPSSSLIGEKVEEWRYIDEKGSEVGPVPLSELKEGLTNGEVTESTLCWAAGVGGWKPLNEIRQLRWHFLMKGESILTYAQVAAVAVKVLELLLRLHPSTDKDGKSVRPMPLAKRLLSSPQSLPYLVQALLCADARVVANVARLLRILCIHNNVVHKLYLSGVFFFALAYPGSNFTEIARLLNDIHLLQQFHGQSHILQGTEDLPLRERSFLGSMLPESLLFIFEAYDARKLAQCFIGNVDTPELIWHYKMRKHLVEMTTQHLCGFGRRLQENPLARYEYCPIPAVKYEELEDELWCHNFYLKNLCDEAKFPDWPIQDPVNVLVGILEAWRNELAKEKIGLDTEEALKVLQLKKEEASDPRLVRNAYRRLARLYHPDKNPDPEAAVMFQSLSSAYETLRSKRGRVNAGPDPYNLDLIISAQRILFKRYSKELSPYKYAGYPLLVNSLTVKPEDSLTDSKFESMGVAAELTYLTCLSSPLNGQQLLRDGGGDTVIRLLGRCLEVVSELSDATSPSVKVVIQLTRVVAGLMAGKAGRDLASKEEHVGLVKWLVDCINCPGTKVPKVRQYALQAVARLSANPTLQTRLVHAGAIQKMIPLLFRYDASAALAEEMEKQAKEQEEEETEKKGKEENVENEDLSAPGLGRGSSEKKRQRGLEGHKTTSDQQIANLHALLVVRALAVLGGYVKRGSGGVHKEAQKVINALLTVQIAEKLEGGHDAKRSAELLRLLTGECENATVIWRDVMRTQLLRFLEKDEEDARALMDEERSTDSAKNFEFDFLSSELSVGGVYIRIFNEDSKEKSVPRLHKPMKFTAACIRFLEKETHNDQVLNKIDPSDGGVVGARMEAVVTALTYVLSVSDEETKAVIAQQVAAKYPESISNVGHCECALERLLTFIAPGRQLRLTLKNVDEGKNESASTSIQELSSLRQITMKLFIKLVSIEAVANSIGEKKLASTFLQNLRAAESAKDQISLMKILYHLCADSPVAVEELVRVGCFPAMLERVCNLPREVDIETKSDSDEADIDVESEQILRQFGARILSRICNDRLHGPKLFLILQRYLPETIALSIRDHPDTAIDTFDSDGESAELVWSEACRESLRNALVKRREMIPMVSVDEYTSWNDKNADWKKKKNLVVLPVVDMSVAEAAVQYKELDRLCFVGGIYVRVFLKDPQSPLRSPKQFLESLLSRVLACGERMIRGQNSDPLISAGPSAESNSLHSTSGPPDSAPLLKVLTSAIVCLLKVRLSLASHVAALGYTTNVVSLLRKTARTLSLPRKNSKAEKNGGGKQLITNKDEDIRVVVGTCMVRLLHEFSVSDECVAKMLTLPLLATLKACTDPLQRDSAFVLDVVKRLLQRRDRPHLMIPLAGQALKAGFVQFIMEKVLSEDDKAASHGSQSSTTLSILANPSGAVLSAIEIIKLLQASPPPHGQDTTEAIIAQGYEELWKQYSSQRHDLFFTRETRTDYFLADAPREILALEDAR
eukprot:g1821.t1